MTNMLRATAWIISPINVLQCLIAHRCLEKNLNRKIDLRLLHYYPTNDPNLSRSVFDTVYKISNTINPCIECIEAMDSTSALSPLHDIPSDFIFLAHDVVGNFFNSLKSAYPDAKTVCYGDALGQHFQKEVHLGFLQPRSFLKRLLARKFTAKDYAILTIPVSQARLPKKTKLLVPDHDLAMSIIKKAGENESELATYCRDLVARLRNKELFLFLIENMAEGEFISSENEIELYAQAIEKNCPAGSTIIIKPHPGEQFDRTALFKERLGDRYAFEKIDPAFKRYPIEIFTPLLEKCRVISMFYPALSLKYLYDIDVIQPMTNEVIEQHFEERFWASYKNAVNLNMIPLKRLQHWDGKSLLYNGR